MKTPPSLLAGIFVLVCSGFCRAQPVLQTPSEFHILEAHGEASKQIIEKAWSVLYSSQVFATNAVGADGDPTTGCWALTVIVRYDREASVRLRESLPRQHRPETKLYMLTGLLALDPENAKRYPITSFSEQLRSSNTHTMHGCNYSAAGTFEADLEELYTRGPQRYLYKELPSIYETIDVARLEPPVK